MSLWLRRPAADRYLVAILILLTVSKGLIWIGLMPIWKIADEPSHFDNIQYRAETLRVPVSDGGKIDKILSPGASAEVRESWETSKHYWRERYLKNTRLVPEEAVLEEWGKNPLKRRTHGQSTALAYRGLYYNIAVVPYLMFKRSSVLTRVMAVRCLSLAFGVMAVLATFFSARLAFNSRSLAFAAGAMVALQPMESQMTAAVNNDAALIGFSAVVLYLQLRALMTLPRLPSLLLGIILGAAATMAGLAKPHGFAMLPGCALVTVLVLGRHLRASRAWLFSLAVWLPITVLVAPYIWSASRPVALPAVATAAGAASGEAVRPSFLEFLSSLDHNYRMYLVRSTWGQFGWLEYSIKGVWLDGLRLAGALVVLGLLTAGVTRVLWPPGKALWFSTRAVVFSAATGAGVVLFILYAEYRFRLIGVVGLIQGRNFLFGLPAMAVVVCAAYGALVPARFRTLSAAALVTMALSLQVAAWVLIAGYHNGR